MEVTELMHSTAQVELIQLLKLFTAIDDSKTKLSTMLLIHILLVKSCHNTLCNISASLRRGGKVWVVLAGRHRVGSTVKTGTLTRSCCVHKVSCRSVTKHSSHLAEHVPVTFWVSHSQTAFPFCHLSPVL